MLGLILLIGGATGIQNDCYTFKKFTVKNIRATGLEVIIIFIYSAFLIYKEFLFSGCVFFAGVFLMAILDRNGANDAQ